MISYSHFRFFKSNVIIKEVQEVIMFYVNVRS